MNRIRKSLADIAHGLRDIPYPGELPREVRHLHAYLADSGHCLMAVPLALRDFAMMDGISDYEIPLPVKYVLEKGYTQIGADGICVDVPYDSEIGVLIPDGYDEF